MLTKEENDKLTRVEGEAPMGQLVRRFWLPFLVSADLPEPDCEPVRVRLLGEDLLAFRDTSGRLGLIDPLCAHRCADLFYGRNEDGGIRCVYHGWKYDVTGQCVDAPTEPKDSNLKLTARLKSYPVVEQAGVLWTYMGPPNLKPELPDFEFMRLPDGHLHTSWSTQACNFAQAIEGGIDTAHSIFLHSTLESHRRLEEFKKSNAVTNGSGSIPQGRYRNRDNPPQLHAVDTDFGVLVGGRYVSGEAEDYWRFNLFYMPFYTAPPGGAGTKLIHAFVPVDDVTTARWSFTFNLDKPHANRDIMAMRAGSGVHVALVPGTHTPQRTRTNNYLIDRQEQRTLSYTGIGGIGEQDFAVQEGMGVIVDRRRERLGVTDGGIMQMRRRLLKAADDLEEGSEPYEASHGHVYHVHAGDCLLPADVANWPEEPKAKAALAPRWRRPRRCYPMSDERLVMPRFSVEERDRRWARVRTAMAERGIDVIVTFPHTGHNAQWEADSRYLTSVGGGGSSTGCVFPIEGEVTAITLNRPEFWAGIQDWVTDVRTSQHHTWSEPIVKRLQELGINRHKIGISSLTGNVRAGDGTVTHLQWEKLNEAFPSATFEDVSVMLGELRAVKSTEEVAAVEKATEITEAGLKAAFEAARPGVTDHEVHAALYYGMLKAGCELPTMVIWGTGRPPAHDAFVPTHRTLERGDMFANEVEGKWMGYSAQRVQPAFLGDIPPGYAEAMEKQRIVFGAALGRFKPGTRFGEVASHVDEVAQELGCRVSLTAHGRGLGEDRPMLVGGAMNPEIARFVLREGNCFILKPAVRLPDGPGINWGDTIAVTPEGGRRLGKDRHEIVVIPA